MHLRRPAVELHMPVLPLRHDGSRPNRTRGSLLPDPTAAQHPPPASWRRADSLQAGCALCRSTAVCLLPLSEPFTLPPMLSTRFATAATN